jgi:hypothetical protein
MQHPISCLEAPKKHMKLLSNKSKLSGQKLHPVSAADEAELFTIQLQPPVNVPARPNAKYLNSPQ